MKYSKSGDVEEARAPTLRELREDGRMRRIFGGQAGAGVMAALMARGPLSVGELLAIGGTPKAVSQLQAAGLIDAQHSCDSKRYGVTPFGAAASKAFRDRLAEASQRRVDYRSAIG